MVSAMPLVPSVLLLGMKFRNRFLAFISSIKHNFFLKWREIFPTVALFMNKFHVSLA